MEDRDVRPNGSHDIEAEPAPSRLRSVERQLLVGDLRRLISGTEAPWISDARVEELTGVEIDEFTTRLEVIEAAEVRLCGIEPRYVLVISDPSVDALALAVDLDPAVIARLACEEFAGELNGAIPRCCGRP